MRIAGTIQDSIVDGEGLRYVVFAQGCPHRCPGCHNRLTWEFGAGWKIDDQTIIDNMLSNPLIDGVTLSGGEPFFQETSCTEIARAAHAHGLNVWCYTGFTFEQLFTSQDDFWLDLLKEIDVLVDGRFEQDKKSYDCKWRGSTNQRVIDVPKSLAKGSVVLYGEIPGEAQAASGEEED